MDVVFNLTRCKEKFVDIELPIFEGVFAQITTPKIEMFLYINNTTNK